MKTYKYKATNLKNTISFLALVSQQKSISGAAKTRRFLRFIHQRVLNVGLARIAPPTNTNFRLAFLQTRFQEGLYEDLPVQDIKFEVYHPFSGLSFIAEVKFWHPPKTVISSNKFISESAIILPMQDWHALLHQPIQTSG